jgi:hypothetical protein
MGQKITDVRIIGVEAITVIIWIMLDTGCYLVDGRQTVK